MKKIFFAILLFCCYAGNAQKRWSFELHGGIVDNLKLPLIIRQNGYPEIRISKADFYSEPLNDPFYWDLRFARWVNKKSMELEVIHHKLYLKNNPPEVERFGISHGFNMLMFNRGREIKKFIFRAGLGSVLMHPESTIRGMEYGKRSGFDLPGYYLSGAVLNFAAAKQIKFGKYFFINTEGKITSSVTNARIANGSARVHVVSFQLILGPGVNWLVRDEKE